MGESVTQLRKDIPVDIAVGIDKLFGVANVCGPIRPRDRTTLKPLEERDRYEGRNFGHEVICLESDPHEQLGIANTVEYKLVMPRNNNVARSALEAQLGIEWARGQSAAELGRLLTGWSHNLR